MFSPPPPHPSTGLVTCIVLAEGFFGDSDIIGIGVDGYSQPLTQVEAVNMVKQYPDWLHTNAGGEIAYLVPGGFFPYEYVTTKPDCSIANNLLSQPRCYFR